ncbi:MAG: hypothetical protein H8E26_14175 [FCB group bacterium]|nr:hypothetical protein [FCB group bacterium]MBL7027431.1 hypothetical protein [Candidatus Neomarinimicrobiota bacterium]MBL7122587.1 hypothetical protein [Candidatus Neomarinimicrobiota bacterium]
MSIHPPSKHVTAQNARFEDFLDDLLRGENVESDLTPDLKAKRRALADNDEFEFCKIYYPQIFDAPFNKLHRWVKDKNTGEWYLSGHRKCGKSAYIYIAKAIRHIVHAGGGVVNIGAETLGISREKTAKLFRLITNNKLIVFDYSPRVIQEEKGHYIINNVHIVATSVQTGLRSIDDDSFRRFKISIADDLYNSLNVGSEAHQAKVLNYVEAEVSGQMEPDGVSYVLANGITSDAPIVKLREKHPGHSFSFPARDSLGRTNWKGHHLYNKKYWDDLEANLPAHVWAGDYMDEPIEVGEIFDPEWIREIAINTIEIIGSLTVCDPSRGKSLHASFKALSTLGRGSDGKDYLLDMYMRKEGWPAVFDYIDELRRSMPKWIILLFENDFEQWDYAEPYYHDWMKKNVPLPITAFKAASLGGQFGSKKDERCLTLVHPHQTGRFLYADNVVKTKDFEHYKTGYLSYGSAHPKKLDGLDATASAYLKLNQYLSLQTPGTAFKSTKARKWPRRRL